MILYTNKHRIPFQIDDADYEAVSQYSWYIGGNGYPTTSIGKGSTHRPIYLHAFLAGRAPDGLQNDHISRDRTDNRRSNLRVVSRTVNMRNTGRRSDNTSGVKGVGWAPRRSKWCARIRVAGRAKTLGWFDTLEAATAARIAAEVRFWDGGEP